MLVERDHTSTWTRWLVRLGPSIAGPEQTYLRLRHGKQEVNFLPLTIGAAEGILVVLSSKMGCGLKAKSRR